MKDWVVAIATLLLVPAIFLGILGLSYIGSDQATPSNDSAADAYEAQLEAESMREDTLIEQERSETVVPPRKTYCEDVTSYDNNWFNDMLCTRPDGSQFYTDYEGASPYELL